MSVHNFFGVGTTSMVLHYCPSHVDTVPTLNYLNHNFLEGSKIIIHSVGLYWQGMGSSALMLSLSPPLACRH